MKRFKVHNAMVKQSIWMGLIKQIVEMCFRCVIYHIGGKQGAAVAQIQDKAVYGFDPVGTVVKFCKIAFTRHYWAWSDSCSALLQVVLADRS
jgi:hypothetical protein